MPCMESLQVIDVKSDEASCHVAQIHAPRLVLISVGGTCPSLAQLFTALHAPVLVSASFHAICDNPMDDPNYVPVINALATLGSPATMEALGIVLDKDSGLMTRKSMYLVDLISLLLVFRNVKHLKLSSCPVVKLVASDHYFWTVTRSWQRLPMFRLWPAYWDPYRPDNEDSDSDGVSIPTSEL